MLAEACGAGPAVEAYTSRAMNGSVPFEVALAARLELMKPSAAVVEACLRAHDPVKRISPGLERLVAALLARGTAVFLVSGGFRQMIASVAEHLGIPADRVFANRLLFDASGAYAGFDAAEPTSRSGGKAVALARIIERFGFKCVAMVGDGVTDMEARPPAALFVGYGGVVARERVRQGADLFVTHFDELTALLGDRQP